MRRQTWDPTALNVMALGWLYSAAIADMYIRSLGRVPTRPGKRLGKARRRPRRRAVDHPAGTLTPQEEVLLLHLLE